MKGRDVFFLALKDIKLDTLYFNSFADSINGKVKIIEVKKTFTPNIKKLLD